jgi:hypothetical protein
MAHLGFKAMYWVLGLVTIRQITVQNEYLRQISTHLQTIASKST